MTESVPHSVPLTASQSVSQSFVRSFVVPLSFLCRSFLCRSSFVPLSFLCRSFLCRSVVVRRFRCLFVRRFLRPSFVRRSLLSVVVGSCSCSCSCSCVECCGGRNCDVDDDFFLSLYDDAVLTFFVGRQLVCRTKLSPLLFVSPTQVDVCQWQPQRRWITNRSRSTNPGRRRTSCQPSTCTFYRVAGFASRRVDDPTLSSCGGLATMQLFVVGE